MKPILLLQAVFLSLGCSNEATVRLNAPASGKLESQVRDTNPNDLGRSQPSFDLGSMRLAAGTCPEADLNPVYEQIQAQSFLDHLRSVGISFQVELAREDLIYVDVRDAKSTNRFRVATLASAPEAARHLHEALLQHGQGSWGVHRSNVAVLGPIGNVESIVGFATSSKLACWGVLTIAGRDDSFAIAGGYQEL